MPKRQGRRPGRPPISSFARPRPGDAPAYRPPSPADVAYPIGTVAYYGPNDQIATKMVLSVHRTRHDPEPTLERWFSEDGTDIREQPWIRADMLAFMALHEVAGYTETVGVFGCPHEEVTDYPEGESCPECPFWAGRDRSVKVRSFTRDARPRGPVGDVAEDLPE